MTYLEMQLRFEQQLSNHINKDLDIRTIDIEYYLNEGYKRFIEEWYKLFEINEAARKRLNPLVGYYSTGTSTVGSHERGRYFTIGANIKYILQEEAAVNYTDCHGDPATNVAEVKPIKLDYYNKHKRNSYKKPYIKLVWRIDLGNGSKTHELIYGDDTNSISLYTLTYLANPSEITLLTGTPETTSVVIAEEFHNEIVEKAVQIALEIFTLNKSLQINN